MTSSSGAGWMPNWSSIPTGSMTLLIGWESSEHHVQVRRLPINKTVAQDLLQPITVTTDRLTNYNPAVYSPDLELDDEEYAVVPREQLDPAGSLLANLETLAPPEAVQNDLTRAMLFYALAVGPASGRLVFVRRANPRANLGRKYMTLFGDELSRVTSPLLSFDLDLIDLVLVAGKGLAVLSLKAYERLFRDSPELLARTPGKVVELNAAMPLTPAAQSHAHRDRRSQQPHSSASTRYLGAWTPDLGKQGQTESRDAQAWPRPRPPPRRRQTRLHCRREPDDNATAKRGPDCRRAVRH